MNALHPGHDHPAREAVERGRERGIALVTVLIFLLILSVVAAGLLVSVNTDTHLASYEVQSNAALAAAEAGVAEAMERIRQGEVPDTLNPKMVTLIFNQEAGQLPMVGSADTTALPTLQEVSNRLSYTTDNISGQTLCISYKTNPARTQIYHYSQAANPAVQTSTGPPIYVIRSTGRVGKAARTIVTEAFVLADDSTPIKAGMVGGHDIKAEKFYVCGYDHVWETPTWTSFSTGRNGATGSCNEDLASTKWELATGGKPGAWSTHKIDLSGSTAWGTPAATQPNQPKADMYAGPWEVYNMNQGDFMDMLGARGKKKKATVGRGLMYYKDADFKGGNGEGILVVEHDLHIKGDFTFRGLIYVGHDLHIDGRCWILGGLIGQHDIKLKDKARGVVLYSSAAIARPIATYSGRFVRLSWREL